jgi:hypothetical protein
MQVLHYLNAAVSLQLTLLEDEAYELSWMSSEGASSKSQSFTCPVHYAKKTSDSTGMEAQPEEDNLRSRSSRRAVGAASLTGGTDSETGDGSRSRWAASTARSSRRLGFSRRQRSGSTKALGVVGPGVQRHMATQPSFACSGVTRHAMPVSVLWRTALAESDSLIWHMLL